jgi:hypothetical protein
MKIKLTKITFVGHDIEIWPLRVIVIDALIISAPWWQTSSSKAE